MKRPPVLVIAIGLVVAAALGSVVAVIAIGSSVSEAALGDGSREHGPGPGHGRAASPAGLHAEFAPATLEPGAPGLDFTLRDRSGAPIDGAAIRVTVVRPAGGSEPLSGRAEALGSGRYRAPVRFAAPGFWDVRLDVGQGGDAVGLVQQVRVEAPASGGAACELAAAPCTVEAGGLAVTLDLGRELATMKGLEVAVTVRRAGAPVEGAAVEVAFAMKDMDMGENRVVLAPAGPGRYAGQAVLVRCHSGRRDWIASVTVRPPAGAPVSVQLPFAVRE